jgi:xanthine dehydrogenase small subunit
MTDLGFECQLSFMINGETVVLDDVVPTMTLLQYLQQSGRTGTKEGCGDGDCGACTVVILSQNSEGKPTYQAMNSCLIPLGSVVGREIITVEGISKGGLHPVQAAMVKTGGSQCGYCTPGFIMSLFAAYYTGQVSDVDVEGNLCRCTGYVSIREAAKLLTHAQPDDDFAQALAHQPRVAPTVNFRGLDHYFFRPTHLQGVLELLQDFPNATLVAGATDLGLELSHHRQQFPVLISVEAVTELQILNQTTDLVDIGAAVPLSQMQTQLHGVFPALDEMLHWFAARQIRNRATIGGNLGTASPIGDLPPVLLALDAEVCLVSLQGERRISLANFFKGYRQTDLQPGEVIRSVIIPTALPTGVIARFSQSYKVGKRGTDDISIVAAAFTVDVDDRDRIVQARLAYGGVAATPIRAIAVETMLLDQPWTMDTIQRVKPVLNDAFTPLSDLRGSAEYRKLLVANLFEKFFVDMTSG